MGQAAEERRRRTRRCRDEDLLGSGNCGYVVERRRCVDETLVLDGELWAVDVRGRLCGEIAGAIRSKDNGVVGNGVARIREVEDPGGDPLGSSFGPAVTLYVPLSNAHVPGSKHAAAL